MPSLLPPIQEPLRKRIERRIRHFLHRLPGDRWERTPYESEARPVLIGGCGRSGSTLVSAMLDSHPRVCGVDYWRETRLFCTPGLNPGRLSRQLGLSEADIRAIMRAAPGKGQFIERLMARWAASRGKARWSEKSPGNVRAIDRVFA